MPGLFFSAARQRRGCLFTGGVCNIFPHHNTHQARIWASGVSGNRAQVSLFENDPNSFLKSWISLNQAHWSAWFWCLFLQHSASISLSSHIVQCRNLCRLHWSKHALTIYRISHTVSGRGDLTLSAWWQCHRLYTGTQYSFSCQGTCNIAPVSQQTDYVDCAKRERWNEEYWWIYFRAAEVWRSKVAEIAPQLLTTKLSEMPWETCNE